ncbi:fumble-domain-containing protein [Dactylonectria macrodidyma]|uniref:Fumble-domain-containing protein n=1 Tax=Dactylonectria macrodidyma TaxID=307937 RepID=A0A9P9JN94_9HYPO|nr:fumble-domain-containing protein [Dactylonectria macrodidyma]
MTPASTHDDTAAPATTAFAQAPLAPASVMSPAQPQQQQPPSMKRRLRTMTSTEEIDSTINRPGSVKINVQGAFIVDPDTSTPASGGGGATAVGAAAAAAHANANANNGRVSPSSHPETSDIRLPNHTAVVSHIAIDIGGSLAKLVYFSREVDSTDPGGRLNFQNFETDRIDDCLEYMRHLRDNQLMLNGSQPGELCVMATGGGAYKFYDKIREALGVNVLREDEMECLIIGNPTLNPLIFSKHRAGLDFFITEIPREVFTYSESDPMQFVPPRDNIYPYLLVNIGSGVSFLKVTGPRSYQRVGGTSLGGGTLWGLLSMLTGARTFDEMLDLAGHGDNAKVDMLVGDIYGADYGKIGLKSTTIASSFGKVFRMKREAESAAEDSPVPHDSESSFSGADVSRSLLYAISNNIGQIAYLQSQIHNLSNIYFGGSFIRGHRQTINTLSYAIKFWSQGEKQAYFLRHEGYLGSVGAFLKRQPRNWGRRGSLEGMEEMAEWRRSQREAEASASTA